MYNDEFLIHNLVSEYNFGQEDKIKTVFGIATLGQTTENADDCFCFLCFWHGLAFSKWEDLQKINVQDWVRGFSLELQ